MHRLYTQYINTLGQITRIIGISSASKTPFSDEAPYTHIQSILVLKDLQEKSDGVEDDDDGAKS